MLAAMVLLRAAASTPAPDPPAEAEPVPEERIREAWSTLWPSERLDVVEWFRLETGFVESFQRTLVRAILARQERDPGLWPERGPTPFFDPDRHAERQAIRRRWLEPDAPDARREHGRLVGAPEPRTLRRRWSYDWASGGLVREPRGLDVEMQFENALSGYGPDLDLARELVLQALDDGAQRAALTAFAHAYTDRSGNAFPGITLYDAWRSGEVFELPDVDTLGIVHDVLDEWKRWRAPVGNQKSLYAAVGDLFQAAQRHRGLREALADCYFIAQPPNQDGYEASAVDFHALWEHHGSEPEALREALPDAQGWRRFLERWAKRCQRDEEVCNGGRNRQWVLSEDERRTRATLVWVLREYGAFERKGRPAVDPGARRTSALPAGAGR